MPSIFFQSRHSQQNADGVIGSPSFSARMAAVNDLQKTLVSVKLRNVDRDMDAARNLLQQNIHLIPLEDQGVIRLLYDDLEGIEEKLEKSKSRLERWLLTMHFKRVSRTTCMMIKRASNRAIDQQIRNKLREATSLGAPPADPADPTTVQSTSLDPDAAHSFPDPCAASTLTGAAVGNADSVDMTALQSQTTGEPAILLRLRRQDEPPQHFVAAVLPDPPPEHRIAGEAETRSLTSSHYPQLECAASDIFGSHSDENN